MGFYIVSPRTDFLELDEFNQLISRRTRKNTLEKMLPQLNQGAEIAVHLGDTNVVFDSEKSYLLNGDLTKKVQLVAEQLGSNYSVIQGIRPISERGSLCLIKNYAVFKRRK